MNSADAQHDDRADTALARQTLATHARSFRFAAAFLSKSVADDAAVVYRFCRHVDDLADESECKETAYGALWTVLRQCRGAPGADVTVSRFLSTLARHNVSIDAAECLVEGAISDLKPVRVRTVDDLFAYAYRVAGVVGRMMCGVIGVRSAKATQYAVDLGLAMQLTNICRDVREDARLNRVYIPSEILKRHGMSSTQLIEGRFTGGQLAGAVDEVLELAERLYNRSLFGMQYIPFRSRVAILVARRVYREIGRKLRRVHDSNPFHGRTVVSFSGKCVQGILGVIDAFRPTTLGLWSPPDPSLPMEDSWTELARPQRLESGQLKLALLEDRLP